jgi:hypothetical protein
MASVVGGTAEEITVGIERAGKPRFIPVAFLAGSVRCCSSAISFCLYSGDQVYACFKGVPEGRELVLCINGEGIDELE